MNPHTQDGARNPPGVAITVHGRRTVIATTVVWPAAFWVRTSMSYLGSVLRRSQHETTDKTWQKIWQGRRQDTASYFGPTTLSSFRRYLWWCVWANTLTPTHRDLCENMIGWWGDRERARTWLAWARVVKVVNETLTAQWRSAYRKEKNQIER